MVVHMDWLNHNNYSHIIHRAVVRGSRQRVRERNTENDQAMIIIPARDELDLCVARLCWNRLVNIIRRQVPNDVQWISPILI